MKSNKCMMVLAVVAGLSAGALRVMVNCNQMGEAAANHVVRCRIVGPADDFLS